MLRMEYQPLLRGSSTHGKLPSWTLFLAVCAAGIGGTFQYGYNVSIINAPTQHIHKFLNETWTSRYHKELNPDLLTFLWSVIASIFSLGGLCGALIGGSMAIRLGRKGALLMNNILAILACILMGISFPTGLFELLIVGRFLIGINSGIGICVQPLYIGEIAPKHLRGGMAMGTSIFLTGGILTGQIIGLSFEAISWFFRVSKGDGRHTAGTFCLRWGETQEALAIIHRPWCEMAAHYCDCDDYGPTAQWDKCWLTDRLRGKKIPRHWGLSPYDPLEHCFNILSDLPGVKKDSFILHDRTIELYSWVPYVSMTSIFAFILSFGLGPGGITNTLTAELFIQSSRPAAYMIGGTISWISFFTIGMLFPFIVNGLKQYCFLVFLLECSLVAAFIFLVIPETKNKSFLEIKKEFHKLNFGRNTKKKDTELYERRQLHDEF
ncbi:solute carrier family 2, facilitated glucose transporter member 11-like isoform X7 [Balearica regulorum gibbericeps]|uniref:solute carrier family 2, facilitated glucose transporter member 11-like isoform X7 n=1 Tax=Balearica regulorum gibbericeps TaxID=100784 RepID=UPI003F5EBE29